MSNKPKHCVLDYGYGTRLIQIIWRQFLKGSMIHRRITTAALTNNDGGRRLLKMLSSNNVDNKNGIDSETASIFLTTQQTAK